MEELIINLHMHSTYSDGHASHAQIAEAALQSGLDAFIVTDHNILVNGIDRYYEKNGQKVLMLVGEEIHDRTREPQKNHLLVIGANRELSAFANDPQRLIDQVELAGGLAFIAHPYDPAMPAFNESDISWVDWQVHGFTGIELWNGFSELKCVAHSKLSGLFYALFPQFIAHGPLPAALQKWDELLGQGNKVVAIGGSDAHALPRHLGPIKKTVFPYTYHFSTINTHMLIPEPLSGDLLADRRTIIDAFRQGHIFIGYDLPATTRGFRFTAQGKDQTAIMGDSIELDNGITFQICIPEKTLVRLTKDGQPVKAWQNRNICTFVATQPGIYRVEAIIDYWGKQRGWIYSNPIYVNNDKTRIK
jgi:hypothetical protein